jgi:hypothetical protein
VEATFADMHQLPRFHKTNRRTVSETGRTQAIMLAAKSKRVRLVGFAPRYAIARLTIEFYLPHRFALFDGLFAWPGGFASLFSLSIIDSNWRDVVSEGE